MSVGVRSDGSKYGIPKDIFFSFPFTNMYGQFNIVENLNIDDECSQKLIAETLEELIKDRNIVEH